jgi:sec-independent protein translocase protein TatC
MEGRSTGSAQRDPEGRMPFVEHLRELRNRLAKALLAIAVAAVGAFFFYREIGSFLLEPLCDVTGVSGVGNNTGCANGALVTRGIIAPLSLSLKISLAAGLVLASPVWLYQLWAFLAPGLHRTEKRYTYLFVASGIPLFLAGASLSYVVMTKALTVLLHFTFDESATDIATDEYLSFVIRMVLVFGLSFELPLILMILNIAGVLTAEKMAGWWRVMIMGIFVFAAVATPTGDPGTMLMLGLPMIALFFLALGLAWLNDRRRARRRAREPDAGLSPDEASVVDTRPSRLDDFDDIS